MAYKTIESTKGNATSCDEKNKKVEGYLLPEVDVYRAKKKGDQATIILHLQGVKKGEIIRMFAPYAIRSAVLESDNTVKKQYVRKLVRFTWMEKIKLANKRSMNRIKIEVDGAKTAPKSKENVPF
jgi:hypothetical protein